MQIEVLEEANPAGADDVTAGLRAHMIEQTGDLPRVPLTLLIRDEDHQVRGAFGDPLSSAGCRWTTSGWMSPCVGRATAPAC
jgi:hypothetical protein